MELADNQLVPIQLLLGWLPKVAVKDARLYVSGLADKHCQSMRDSGYLLVPFDNGWAYEVQEGGPGKAYLPAILKTFTEARKAGMPVEEVERFVIETTTRRVQVEIQPEGFTTVMLPESALTPATQGLTPETTLMSLAPERRSVLFIGGVVLAAGVLAFAAALIWKYQPQLTPNAPVVSFGKGSLAYDQWNMLASTPTPPGTMVTKLEYAKGKWDVVKGPSE